MMQGRVVCHDERAQINYARSYSYTWRADFMVIAKGLYKKKMQKLVAERKAVF